MDIFGILFRDSFLFSKENCFGMLEDLLGILKETLAKGFSRFFWDS